MRCIDCLRLRRDTRAKQLGSNLDSHFFFNCNRRMQFDMRVINVPKENDSHLREARNA